MYKQINKMSDKNFLRHLDSYLSTITDSDEMLDVINKVQSAVEKQLKLDKK